MPSPIRTCLGCREKADKAELLRVVSQDGSLGVDPLQQLPGRGAYVHRTRDCVDLAANRRRFGRALRAEVDPVRAQRALYAVLGEPV